MIIRRHRVSGDTTPITICPIGDIQWVTDPDDSIAVKHLEEHIAACLERPNPLFLGTGDYIDFASPSNRVALQRAGLYDTMRKEIEDKARELTDAVYRRILKPTAGKWLGLLTGHHMYEFSDGTNTDQILASKLGAAYLGYSTLIRVEFVAKRGDAKRGGALQGKAITVYAHHGRGSGVMPHSPLNVLYQHARSWDADIFVMGHQTKKAHSSYDYVAAEFAKDSDEGILVHRQRHLVGAGGWSKGYIAGDSVGTYVEQGMMNPVALGQPMIHVRPRYREGINGNVWEPGISVES